MQEVIITPTNVGQICKIIMPLDDENAEDVYIISEDPKLYDLEDSIYVVNLKDLQRNSNAPQFTPQIAIAKGDLKVVAEDLEQIILSWNHS
ncbi:hypothetical protein [Mucilaginibacter jinjuensis]|uniref:Uncharacterized protein n=1 Tax=Mucilaginibacter jinjuensis TaxID=1176721 RepID=A0ABY7TD23_9SPHI|nr:hypothetical protein [Mucilaginibacter jinjuensis]WCT14231.1 hypothetical protein PQO05_09825 [Mucilaginibacter jinjuensis]